MIKEKKNVCLSSSIFQVLHHLFFVFTLVDPLFKFSLNIAADASKSLFIGIINVVTVKICCGNGCKNGRLRFNDKRIVYCIGACAHNFFLYGLSLGTP